MSNRTGITAARNIIFHTIAGDGYCRNSSRLSDFTNESDAVNVRKAYV